jgi:fibronectin type 3 domain-containing protein
MAAAQSLYGETFEINIAHGDIMQIVNKARETDQRFSIAVFCADMSPVVARASGLYLGDKKIEKNVKYLYRVSVLTPTDTLRGSIFIDTNEKYQLPKVVEASAESAGNIVTLKWNQETGANFYTSYSVERSENGIDFTPISDVTDVSVTNNGQQDPRYQYAGDTLALLDKEYSYRIRGISPFGEFGPPSEILHVTGSRLVTADVFITTALSADNKSIDVQWDFPTSQNEGLKGFEVTRSAKSSGPYKAVLKDILPPTSRSYRDITPEQTNYYQIKAKTVDGRDIISMPYLALLVDSVPPVIPSGLHGQVSDEGKVRLAWKPNPDADIYGYRIYRAYYKSEEFAQLTSEPIQDTVFADAVELKSLNEKVHYKIMAIDKNQNHSVLSTILSLSLPDKVPPMAPVWLPVKSEADGVHLTWLPGGSDDVVSYALYRETKKGWLKINTQPEGADTLRFADVDLKTSDVQRYTVLSIDDAGLESPPAPVVTGFKLPGNNPAVELKLQSVDRSNKRIILSWSPAANISVYRVYKKINDGPLQLYKTTSENKLTDIAVAPGQSYSYQVVVVFKNGALSSMSKKVAINY